jgi:mevalonate kinase
VAAIDLRLTATLSPQPSGPLVLELPALGLRLETTREQLGAYSRQARERWLAYAAAPSSAGFSELRGDDPAHLVKAALGEGLEHLAGRRRATPPAFRLRLDSAIPVGSGFGSSAATAIGILGALFLAGGLPLDDPQLEALALEVERRQHGSPSGVDGAAALHGGLLWARKAPEGGLETEGLGAGSPLLRRFRVFHTGTPPEATGTVVAAVRHALEAEPGKVGSLLDRIGAATLALRREVESATGDEERTIASLRECQRCLEALGVVPEAVREPVRQIEAAGGAAKISGAGSLTGPGGGSLVAFHPRSVEGSDDALWSSLAPYPCYAVRLGAEGLRREGSP